MHNNFIFLIYSTVNLSPYINPQNTSSPFFLDRYVCVMTNKHSILFLTAQTTFQTRKQSPLHSRFTNQTPNLHFFSTFLSFLIQTPFPALNFCSTRITLHFLSSSSPSLFTFLILLCFHVFSTPIFLLCFMSNSSQIHQ